MSLVSFFRESYVVAWKDMRLWVKNPMVPFTRSLMLPLLWIVIFGTAFGGAVTHVPVAVVMQDHSTIATNFVSELGTGNTLKLIPASESEAFRMLKYMKVSAVILVPGDFSTKIKEGGRAEVMLTLDDTTPQISTAVSSKVYGMARAFSSSGKGIQVDKNTLYGKGITYLDFLAPGVIIMTIIFSSFFSGGLSLIMDREFGTITMLLVSPISRDAIIMGKIFAGVLQSLTSGIVALVIALIMGVKIRTGFDGFLIILLILLIAGFGFIGMSTALAVKINELDQLMVVTQTIIMPMWFISGGLYPIASMPHWMRIIAMLNPLTYATNALRAVMLRGIIWQTLTFDIAVITVFAFVMLFVGSYLFKKSIS